MSKSPATELERVVIRFAGDSGDGMQLTGSQFSFTSALIGNDLATFPDFPAEIRAPQGTVEGVSGFQVQIGKVDVLTPGDEADVLVAMNPAALKSNLKWVRKGGNIIVDVDAFETRNIEKAGFKENPLTGTLLSEYHVIEAPITTLTKSALEGAGLDNKSVVRCKNMFALGIMYWLFSRSMDQTIHFLETKFKKKPELAEANVKVLRAGYYYAETVEALASTFDVPSAEIEPGIYRHISGNTATAWGLMAAAEKMNRQLFLGSYPITPASDILHELAKHKQLNVLTVQAEDEIAAVCSAIGATYAGSIGVTTSAGPGIALKGEAIGLAGITELPLVVVDVQRGGPSTGLPTKTEQADLNMALYGRNSDNPIIIVAPCTPSDCFTMGYEAVRLAHEHATPAMILSDGYLANGSEPWKFPAMKDLADITPMVAKDNGGEYLPYLRDPEKLARYLAFPGTPGMEHRIGGLEKQDVTGHVSYDPENHEKMVKLRCEKVARVANYIPLQEVSGADKGDVLVVGWGGTYGSLQTAVERLQAAGKSVSHTHFRYINPLPRNTKEILGAFKSILVCELNMGQFANYLRTLFPELPVRSYTKIQGLPFTVSEVQGAIEQELSR
ncbi:MAG: 2-oxoacid:acceptor oxidoreductase subunit alpha [Flavobacteriales bacterium]|nr:2-oxoacid:acceptor oxidoreductase subunit alpha [Flavobacteriales bacterium]